MVRQHQKVEKTVGDRTEGSEAVVEVAAMEEATVAELEAVNRWAVLGVDMEVEVNKVFNRHWCLKRCFFRPRYGLWWWLCLGRWCLPWTIPW